MGERDKKYQKYRTLLKQEIRNIEESIYRLEKLYLEETMNYGNILKGWDYYVSYKKKLGGTELNKNVKINEK